MNRLKTKAYEEHVTCKQTMRREPSGTTGRSVIVRVSRNEIRFDGIVYKETPLTT